MTKESQITQLEKRARGFRRIISSLNDLPMYGINERIDKILHVKIDALKEHLKLKITRNNDKLNEMYTESVDSLSDDDGQQGTVAPVEIDHHATDKTFENDR
jgi:hypothetical protein|tara:strand:+ start:780 stop:1085 length:306 start_codon:yes stop_codon:yes gene_type:complete